MSITKPPSIQPPVSAHRSFPCHLLMVILLGCLVLSSVVWARQAALTNIIVTNTRDDLLLYLTIEEAFREQIQEAIYSGVPVSFSLFVTLHEVRPLWFNRQIADLHVTHAIKYNNLKDEFTIERSWEDNQPRIASSFEEAQRLMSDVDSLKVISLQELKKNGHYRLAVKAQLSRVTLPLYLHYILFFVSLWDFETDWYSIDFIY